MTFALALVIIFSGTMIRYLIDDKLTVDEYVEFLSRSDLGHQYPRKNFTPRIERLLHHIDICISARNETGHLVGICFGLTDFAYFPLSVVEGCSRKLISFHP